MASRRQGRAALLVIDVQEGFKHPTHWGQQRSNPDCEANVAQILAAFRESADKATASQRLPSLVVHVQHISEAPGSVLHPHFKFADWRGADFQQCAQPRPGEPVLQKSVNSAFIGTDLEALLRREQVADLFIVGLTTDHCVSTTTRMAANLKVTTGDWGQGRVVLVGDATATWAKGAFDADTIQAVHLASLENEFAEIWSTAEVVRWLTEQAR